MNFDSKPPERIKEFLQLSLGKSLSFVLAVYSFAQGEHILSVRLGRVKVFEGRIEFFRLKVQQEGSRAALIEALVQSTSFNKIQGRSLFSRVRPYNSDDRFLKCRLDVTKPDCPLVNIRLGKPGVGTRTAFGNHSLNSNATSSLNFPDQLMNTFICLVPSKLALAAR